MNEELIKQLYERIKDISKLKNITQVELCENCNIKLQSHRNRITKNIAPDAIDIVNIANYLNTSVEYLVTGQESDNHETIKKIEADLRDAQLQLSLL